jgi:AraC-like DNA-binding protein
MAEDWSRYWRSPAQPLEAMHAHFERHIYHRHSHDAYSFGVTEAGVQAFRCRGSLRTSAAGMVMAFNPDDPHDGHAGDRLGFTYRMIHLGPELVEAILAESAGKRASAKPLFPEPVLDDPALAARLSSLHRALVGGAPALRRDEALTAAVLAIVRRGSTPRRLPPAQPAALGRAVERARALLHDDYLADLTTDDLAAAAGCSRYALYRAFRATYGMGPSDYQRLLRLRAARRLIASGHPIVDTAVCAGFTDQAHLTRWFGRAYGITPGAYRRAAAEPSYGC